MAIKYTSNDKVMSGMPMGGIGCGSIQIFPDGTRGVFTGMNNWEQPKGNLHWFRQGTGGDYRVSNPFAIFINNNDKKVSKLLQTQTIANCPTVKEIKYSASFPVAELDFVDNDLGAEVKMTAFSPFIREEYKDSSLPGVVYTFTVKNTTKNKIEASLLSTAFNCVGKWNVERHNKVVSKDGLVGINFKRDNCHPNDETDGVITIATEKKDKVTYLGEWNYVGENFCGKQEDRNFQVWKYFSEDGELPCTNTGIKTVGEGDEWMGALAVKFKLLPGQTKRVNFYYTWYMPKHHLGHMYENWFKDSFGVASYLKKNRVRLYSRSMESKKVLEEAPLEGWLKDAMINQLAVISAASWWTKKDIFVMYENPVKWPLMDSLDVRYYGTAPLLLYFPELEKNTMRIFKNMQRKDGRIPHDLGWSQINCPSDGTTAGRPWKDLSTKYALMVYRNYLWTKDTKGLKEMWPSIKRAMEWEFKTDLDGNGLPDNEGKDQTYDLWEFHGTSSYTSSIYLSALLACIKMAEKLGDKKFAAKCKDYYTRGQTSFEEELWTGSYYIAGKSKDKVYDACIASQLNGQWYAHTLGLGYIVDEERAKKACQTIIKLNGSVSKYGVVNSVYPNGQVDRSSYHAENIWAGECYAFCSLAVYEGFIEDGMRLAKLTWDNFQHNVKNVWYQPDVVFAKDGAMGDGELYVRNLAIWTLALAMAKHDNKVKAFFKKLEPGLTI